jgi:hypothetical protein
VRQRHRRANTPAVTVDVDHFGNRDGGDGGRTCENPNHVQLRQFVSWFAAVERGPPRRECRARPLLVWENSQGERLTLHLIKAVDHEPLIAAADVNPRLLSRGARRA